jgi:hypothetical protein
MVIPWSRMGPSLLLLVVGCTVNVNQTSDTEEATESATGDGTTQGTSGDTLTTGDDPTTTGATTEDSTSTGVGSTTDDSTGGTTEGTTGDATTTTTGGDMTTGDATTGDSTTGDSTTDGTTGGMLGACPDGWTRARVVTVTNAPNKPLEDFQTAITVDWDDDMQVDFIDVRFVSDQGVVLPHWIEEFTAPIDALFWVRVPDIAPAGTTELTMCYGNPDAEDVSDGYATFDFFDGFESDTLDIGKWLFTSPPTMESGYLRVIKGAVFSKGSPGSFPNTIAEYKAHVIPNTGTEAPGMRVSAAQSWVDPSMWMQIAGYYFANIGDPPVKVLASNFQNQNCCDGTENAVYGLAVDDANVYVYGERVHTDTAIGTWSGPYFIGLGYHRMNQSGVKDIGDLMVDWVLVRQFTSIEPKSEIGPETTL